MRTLITTAEVAVRCFGGDPNIHGEFIKDPLIISAQRKFLRPVLGKSLWAAIERGEYDSLVNEYVKPALALYVKLLVLPLIAVQVGAAGVVRYAGQNFDPAGDKSLAMLLKHTRREARTLLSLCVEHIESLPGSYPEYDPGENIWKKVNMEGGILL